MKNTPAEYDSFKAIIRFNSVEGRSAIFSTEEEARDWAELNINRTPRPVKHRQAAPGATSQDTVEIRARKTGRKNYTVTTAVIR